MNEIKSFKWVGLLAAVLCMLGGLICFPYNGVNIGPLPGALGLYMLGRGAFMVYVSLTDQSEKTV